MVRLTEPNSLNSRREHRGLTRAALGEVAGATSGVIALFEAGKRSASEKWWVRLAPLPDMRPGDLMTSDPSKG